jgi:hypothetical protein
LDSELFQRETSDIAVLENVAVRIRIPAPEPTLAVSERNRPTDPPTASTPEPSDVVEWALAVGLERASAAARWDVGFRGPHLSRHANTP